MKGKPVIPPVHLTATYKFDSSDDLIDVVQNRSGFVYSRWDNPSIVEVENELAAMEGYRAADLVVLALEKAGADLTVEGVVAALEGIADYTDIFGYQVSFGPEKHSGATQSVLSQVQNGRWVPLAQSIGY